jgi:hypothetical protein
MSDTLDLDILAPEKKTVKVNGKLYDINPLKLKDFLTLQRLLKASAGKSETEMVNTMGDIFESLKPIVPNIDEMDLTMKQTIALLDFIYKQEELAQAQDTQKKTEV